MFFTAISHAEEGHIQRIGTALSDDLVVWTRSPDNPVLEADVRWYEKYDADVWFEAGRRGLAHAHHRPRARRRRGWPRP
jgi:beta-fructofuranosidase